MISFVIPAHNEESMLPRTLMSVRSAAEGLSVPFEIIVVDDDSTDGTVEAALRHGAIVERVALRRIGAVRNAGAARARGDLFIFVDADTAISVEVLREVVEAIASGAAGGGARVAFDDPGGWWGRGIMGSWNLISRWMRLAAGCFVFARRDAFEAAGGFDESYYIGEEIILSMALKRQGRFAVLPVAVTTSARKVHLHGKLETLWLIVRLLFSGRRAWKRREGLDLWYRRREGSGKRTPR